MAALTCSRSLAFSFSALTLHHLHQSGVFYSRALVINVPLTCTQTYEPIRPVPRSHGAPPLLGGVNPAFFHLKRCSAAKACSVCIPRQAEPFLLQPKHVARPFTGSLCYCDRDQRLNLKVFCRESPAKGGITFMLSSNAMFLQ